MTKTKKVNNSLDELISVLEDNEIKVTTKELDHAKCINLKLTSDNALDVIVNKLVELAANKEVVISTNSLVDSNSYDIYVEERKYS